MPRQCRSMGERRSISVPVMRSCTISRRGVSSAKLCITSADGKNVYNVTTDRGGTYGVPGLGCTTWTVRLLSAPDAPGGIQANRVIVSNLNGGKYTSAEVRFRAQP